MKEERERASEKRLRMELIDSLSRNKTVQNMVLYRLLNQSKQNKKRTPPIATATEAEQTNANPYEAMARAELFNCKQQEDNDKWTQIIAAQLSKKQKMDDSKKGTAYASSTRKEYHHYPPTQGFYPPTTAQHRTNSTAGTNTITISAHPPPRSALPPHEFHPPAPAPRHCHPSPAIRYQQQQQQQQQHHRPRLVAYHNAGKRPPPPHHYPPPGRQQQHAPSPAASPSYYPYAPPAAPGAGAPRTSHNHQVGQQHRQRHRGYPYNNIKTAAGGPPSNPPPTAAAAFRGVPGKPLDFAPPPPQYHRPPSSSTSPAHPPQLGTNRHHQRQSSAGVYIDSILDNVIGQEFQKNSNNSSR